MKVKISLIPFIPALIAMIGLKLMSLFGLDSNGMFLGMNKMGITYAVIGIALGLFVVCVLINIFDRKTAPVYPVKRNIFAGIFAILSGASVIASSVLTFINQSADSEYYFMLLACAGFSVPAGIALMMMSKVHFTGKSTLSGASMLYIFPALWGCSELVFEFLVATKESISSSDMTALFTYIFLSLYLFSHSMIVSRIKGRNPVKACFIYGLPAIALSSTLGLYTVCTSMVEGFEVSKITFGAELIIISLYMLSFVIEMAFNSYTKDEIEIIDSLPSDEDTYENSYVRTGGYDELVFSEREADDPVAESVETDIEASNETEKYSNIPGLNDFIIGIGEDTETTPIQYVAEPNKDEVKVTEKVVEVKAEPKIEKPIQEVIKPVFETAKPATKATEIPAKPIRRQVVEQPSMPTIKPSAATDNKPKRELSDIDLLLQELDSKK